MLEFWDFLLLFDLAFELLLPLLKRKMGNLELNGDVSYWLVESERNTLSFGDMYEKAPLLIMFMSCEGVVLSPKLSAFLCNWVY